MFNDKFNDMIAWADTHLGLEPSPFHTVCTSLAVWAAPFSCIDS